MDWNKVFEWLKQNTTTEVYAIMLAALIAMIATNLYTRFSLSRARNKLRKGDASEQVIVQLNKLVMRETAPTLLLRNLPGGGTVDQVLAGNPALAKLAQKLAKKTNISRPVLRFEGEEGKQTIHTFVNHVIEASSTASFPLKKVLLAVTCEDRRFINRTQIRIFIMDPEELRLFENPSFCVRVAVERPWQSLRVLALHIWAKQYAEEKKNRQPLDQTWEIELPVRDDYSILQSLDVDWKGGMEVEALREAGLVERFQKEEELAENTEKEKPNT